MSKEGSMILILFALSTAAFGQEDLIGTWEIEADEVTIDVEEATFSANDYTLEEFWVEIGRMLAEAEAESEGVADEEYDEFEQNMVDFVFELFPPDELLNDLTIFFDGTMTYEVDGDLLTTTDDETIDQWRRVTPSPVLGTSWGQVKSSRR